MYLCDKCFIKEMSTVELSRTFVKFTFYSKNSLKLITQKMEFKRRFGNRKRSKPKKGLFLVVLLVIALILWFKAEALMEALF